MVDLPDSARYHFHMKTFHGEDFLINKAMMLARSAETPATSEGATRDESPVFEAGTMPPSVNLPPSSNPPLNWLEECCRPLEPPRWIRNPEPIRLTPEEDAAMTWFGPLDMAS